MSEVFILTFRTDKNYISRSFIYLNLNTGFSHLCLVQYTGRGTELLLHLEENDILETFKNGSYSSNKVTKLLFKLP
jgi:hypothetical protein